MTLQTAQFLVQRDSVDYKVSGERIQNAELKVGDTLLVDRGGTNYRWVLTELNDGLDTSNLLDTDKIGCYDGDTHYQVSGARFKTLIPDFYFASTLIHVYFIAGGYVKVNGGNGGAKAVYRVDTGTPTAIPLEFGKYEIGNNFTREYYILLDTTVPFDLFATSEASSWEFGPDSRGMDKITSVANWFRNCTNYTDPNIGDLDVSNIKFFGGCFEGCTNFNSDLSNWDTSNAQNMDYMFNGAQSFTKDISNWCVTNITSKPTLFDNNSGFFGFPSIQPQWGTCP